MRTTTFLICLAATAAACHPSDSQPSSSGAESAAAVTTAALPARPASAGLRLETAPTGNQVRYRVRERLVDHDLPNDAVGTTTAVTGAITFDSTGGIMPSSSRFVAQVSGLKSDRDRRDGYVQKRLLQTSEYPSVVLAPTEVRGLTYPLPTSGSDTFDIVGKLTVKGVTKPTVWRATATFTPEGVTGTSATAFTFDDFGLTQPRVPVLLSVADTIRLEYDFKLVSR